MASCQGQRVSVESTGPFSNSSPEKSSYSYVIWKFFGSRSILARKRFCTYHEKTVGTT